MQNRSLQVVRDTVRIRIDEGGDDLTLTKLPSNGDAGRAALQASSRSLAAGLPLVAQNPFFNRLENRLWLRDHLAGDTYVFVFMM